MESKYGIFALLLVLLVVFGLSVKNEGGLGKEQNASEGLPADERAEESLSDAVAVNNAYLTFDDGPTENTGEILKILETYGIPATFFVIGSQVTDKTELFLQQALAQGCEIGVHTDCHRAEKIYQSAESYYQDVMKAKKTIEDITGEKVGWFRFPWGSNNCYLSPFRKSAVEMLQREGLEYTDWNVSGEDSVGRPDAQTILNHVKKDSKIAKEPVILLHDSEINKETVKALPDIIDFYLEKGYQFAKLEERTEPCHFCTSR